MKINKTLLFILFILFIQIGIFIAISPDRDIVRYCPEGKSSNEDDGHEWVLTEVKDGWSYCKCKLCGLCYKYSDYLKPTKDCGTVHVYKHPDSNEYDDYRSYCLDGSVDAFGILEVNLYITPITKDECQLVSGDN